MTHIDKDIYFVTYGITLMFVTFRMYAQKHVS